tara:strand:- start:4625 stop:5266 length:642 start_codon:yes stop_codon:yes gene_type:complete
LNIIFVADIFGLTDEFEHFCQQAITHVKYLLSEADSLAVEWHMIGPYHKQPALFSCEQDAYQYFIKNVTLEGYVKKLEQKLLAVSGSKLLVGFSVGGSAIWQLHGQQSNTEKSSAEKSAAAICFYSSQIRHMTHLTPHIPITMILPSAEQHFSIEDLRVELGKKSTVTIEQSEYLHGFMNKLSVNYHPFAYQYYTKRLAELLASNIHTSVNDK